jgi:chaperone required for assembly of F1-ATPase
MSDWAARRFWTETTTAETDGGYEVRLDGRRVRTPAKAALILPTPEMAGALAAEWDAQGEKIAPESMPFTRSANAAIDKVAPQRAEVIEMLAAYGDSDLLCYRADAPEELIARQAQQWDPALDWAEADLGARLQPRTGVMHAPQDPAVLARLAAPLHTATDFELAALHDLISLSGSLVLGLAAARGWQTPETIWDVSQLDETWQAEQWGADDEAEAMTALKRAAFLHAARFHRLSRPSAA